MNNTTTLSINGVCTLTAPLHQAAFGGAESNRSGIKVTRQMKMPLSLVMAPRSNADREKPADVETEDDALDDLRESLDEDDETPVQGGYTIQVPIISGNSIRGRLSRKAADRIQSVLIEKGQQISDRVYYSLRNGRASVAGEAAFPRLDKIQAAHDDLKAGIFGVETVVPSKLVTPDLIPLLDCTAPLVPDRYAHQAVRGIESWKTLFTSTIRSVDDIEQGADVQAANVWEGGREALQAYMADRLGDNDAYKTRDKAAKPEDDQPNRKTFANIINFECVAPLTPFLMRLSFDRLPSEAHAGFALLILADFLEERHLGGIGRLGYGTYDASLDVTINGEEHYDAIKLTDAGLTLAPALEALIEKGRQALDGVNAEGLSSVHGQLTRPKATA